MGQQLLSVSADAKTIKGESVKVLSVSTDSKTVKGEKVGVLTGILYLAPSDISGFQVCPKSTKGCKAACLYSAGRSVAFPKINEARIRKTRLFFTNRPLFMSILFKNLKSLIKKAKKQDMLPAVRLNGTSDITWEKIKFEMDGKKYRNIMEAFPTITFYDYTKILGRKAAVALPNYHLTFSLSESNDRSATKALANG